MITALFADLVGFTALAENLDPEEVKRLIDLWVSELAAIIVEHGGVVDKVMGDAIVALFGAPVAHEDDPERAVRAGLNMQVRLAELAQDHPVQMRIGINTGEVLVGMSQAGGDYTAMGDVMNTASRLEAMAEPGQVLVGEPTRTATSEAISYEPLGLVEARGKSEQIAVWSAIAAVRPPGERPTRQTPFVGRQDELGLLGAQVRLALDGSRAQLAFVVGEAGVGKSRFAAEVADRAVTHHDALILRGRCLPYGEANVWWPVAEQIRSLVGIESDAATDKASTLVSAKLERLLGPGAELARFHRALLHAMGYETSLRGGDRSFNRAEVTLAMTTVIEAELAHQPVVLLVSDVHWAQAPVRELVSHLMRELARQPLFAILTSRQIIDGWPAVGRYGSSVVHLDSLSISSARELVRAVLPELADQRPVVDELVRRSGGNPFFLEELAATVATNGLGATSDSIVDLPTTLRGLVSARLDALPAGARVLLEEAAVLGRNGSLRVLAAQAQRARSVEDISAEIGVLVEADLLGIDGSRFEFRSDLIREVAYGTLTKAARARVHAEFAALIVARSDPDRIRNSAVAAVADHYQMAAQLASEMGSVPGVDGAEVHAQALKWTAEAGERALAAGAPKDAQDWFAAGLELARRPEDQVRFLFGRARARSELHDLARARGDLDRVTGLGIDDPHLAARAKLVAGDLDRKSGDQTRAATRLADAAEELAALGDHENQSLALRLLGMTEMYRSERAAADAFAAACQVAADAGDRRAEAWALQSMAQAAFGADRITEARDLIVQADNIFAEIGDASGRTFTRGLQAWISFHLGEWDVARTLLDTVLPETRRRGDPWALSIMLTLQASLELWTGQPRPAAESAREALSEATRAKDAFHEAHARSLLGRALVATGDVGDGLQELETAFAHAERSGDTGAVRVAAISNCAAAAKIGDHRRAIRWAARFAVSSDEGSRLGEVDLVTAVAIALLQQGSVADAASQLAWPAEVDSAGRFGQEAAIALVAAASGDHGQVATSIAIVQDGNSTYLDRVLAWLAGAGSARATGDAASEADYLGRAQREVMATEDVISRSIVEIFESVLLRGPGTHRSTAVGLDENAWAEVAALVGGFNEASVSGEA